MNTKKLEQRRKQAEKEWAKFQNNQRPLIYVGAGSCGLAAGASEVLGALEAYVKDKKQDVDVVKVGCIGPCYLEPLVDFQLPGRPRVSYCRVTPADVPAIVDETVVGGRVLAHKLLGLYEQGADEITFLNITAFRDFPLQDMPMLEVLERTSKNVFVPLTIGGGIRDFTDRNGRYVLVVRAEHRTAIPGIIHGSSASGASLYLEPLSTVEINNDIVALEEQEAAKVPGGGRPQMP